MAVTVYQQSCGCAPASAPTYQVLQPVVTYSSGTCGGICVYENVTHLRTETVLSLNKVALLKGLTSAYDNEGHIYIFEPSETTADDGVNYIRPNIIDASLPGRWRLWT